MPRLTNCPRLALTTGEPAGIGPDLAILLSQKAQHTEIISLCCPQLIKQRAAALNINMKLSLFNAEQKAKPNMLGEIKVKPFTTNTTVTPGKLNKANASYVINLLDDAILGCSNSIFDAMVTAPVQKSIINDAGIPFSGHTEYLAEKLNSEQVVMMLATEELRVALATTHLPLKDVAKTITQALLTKILTVLAHDLRRFFGIQQPHILVAGLNPHAGEGGHLGREELDTIIPCLEALRAQQFHLIGPLPADTLFTPKYLDQADAVLAMYHDQGLPVLKYAGFGRAANISLGLPIIRTSVDHGTALDLAATGNIDVGSLQTAINIAATMVAC